MSGLNQNKIGVIFLSVLEAYQAKLVDLLGEESSNLITEETIPFINNVIDEISPNILKANSVDEALKIYTNVLIESKLVSSSNIEKKNDKYVLTLNDCFFAVKVHFMLKPRNLTCIWALFAMAIVGRLTKKKVKIQPSEILQNGSKTIIEFR